MVSLSGKRSTITVKELITIISEHKGVNFLTVGYENISKSYKKNGTVGGQPVVNPYYNSLWHKWTVAAKVGVNYSKLVARIREKLNLPPRVVGPATNGIVGTNDGKFGISKRGDVYLRIIPGYSIRLEDAPLSLDGTEQVIDGVKVKFSKDAENMIIANCIIRHKSRSRYLDKNTGKKVSRDELAPFSKPRSGEVGFFTIRLDHVVGANLGGRRVKIVQESYDDARDWFVGSHPELVATPDDAAVTA